MSLELVRESIKINEVICEDSIQTVVESDIIVPDVKPDIGRILLVDGDVFIGSSEVLQDKIAVGGTIRYKILYVCEDDNSSIKSINTNTGFSCELRILGARAGMRPYVKCEMEHTEYSILNGRKINIRSIVKVDGKAFEEQQKEIVGDIRGNDDMQVLKDNVGINYYLGHNRVEVNVGENLEVPAGKPSVREILRNDVKISGKEYKVADDRIVARGGLNISTLYIGDDEEGSFQSMEHEIPFTQFIDMEGIGESSVCELDYGISDCQFEAAEDSDGELRVLKGEIILNISAAGFDKRNIQTITDAYAPQIGIELKKEPFRLEEVLVENKSQIILKDTISLSGDSPDIAEVFNVLCKPGLSECKVYDDKVVIEGLVNNNVLYLANNSEQPICSYSQEVPFRQNIDIKGIRPDMKCDAVLDIEHYNYSVVSSNEVEIRLAIAVGIKASNQAEIPLLVNVEEYSFDQNRKGSNPSVVLYYSQTGDTLWKIAKKYLTTIDDIKKVNDISDKDLAVPGRQVLIPKRIV